MSTYIDGLEAAAQLVEVEFAATKEQDARLKQIASHIRDLGKRVARSQVVAPLLPHFSDSDLRRMWRAAAGEMHSRPDAETWSMVEPNIFRFLRELADVAVKRSTPSATATTENEALQILIEMHRLMDFEEPVAEDSDCVSDPSAINAAFAKAYALIRRADGGGA